MSTETAFVVLISLSGLIGGVLFALFTVFLHLRVNHNSTLLLAVGAVSLIGGLLLHVKFSVPGEAQEVTLRWYVGAIMLTAGKIAEVVGLGWFTFKVARRAGT